MQRSRPRRRSDGNTGAHQSHCPSPPYQSHLQSHPLSVQSLQSELRSLCVSSPPSLQTSPIHGGNICMGQPVTMSQSPPSGVTGNALQIISEENLSQQTSVGDRRLTTNSPASLPSSPLPFLALTFTPPHSFRTSPVPTHSVSMRSTAPCAGQAVTPAISVTDELGAAHFPILPPPHAFAHFSQPNLQRQRPEHDVRVPEQEQEAKFTDMCRWKDGKVTHGVTACSR